MSLLTWLDINLWTGVMWITLMFLSAVWTLILMAPIHCRWFIGEQVVYWNEVKLEIVLICVWTLSRFHSLINASNLVVHVSRIYFLKIVLSIHTKVLNVHTQLVNETHCIEINMAEMLGTSQLHVTNQELVWCVFWTCVPYVVY